MADGQYRLPETGSHYYPTFSHSHSRTGQRHNKSSTSRFFSPNSTSPSRSSRPSSPSQSAYAMYNSSNQHLLNGASHQRFGLPIGVSKPFQSQHHGHSGGHHAQHQEGGHGHGHQNNYSHHQHSHSGGTGVTNGGAHYGSHMQNGTPGALYSLEKPPNDHWALQIQMAQQEREWTMSLPRARNAQGTSKNQVINSASLNSEVEKEERQRPGTESVAKPQGQAWVELDLGGNALRSMTPVLFEYDFLTKLYFNNNRLRVLPESISRLRGLKCLDLSLNELTSLPSSIGMLVNLKELLLFDNRLESLPYEIGNLFQCQVLGLVGNPLNEDLKNIIMEQESKGLIKHLRENAPTPDPPAEREWLTIEENDITEEDKISLFTYNILCHHYCTPTLYGYTPSAALSWEHRREVILNELRNRHADIICLQEMEGDAFDSFFRPNLAYLDYKGVFVQKNKAKTMGPNEAKMVDGCATFYKNSKYILLDKQLIDIPGAAINRPDMKGEADIYNRVMPKDNVAVVTFFENRQTGTRLIVANCHLHWDQEFKDVKVVQVAVLLEQITKLAEQYSRFPPLKESEKKLYRFANGDAPDGAEEQVAETPMMPSVTYTDPLSIPLIFCGDFNSLPNSGPYELISSGSLAPNHSDLAGRKYGNFTRDGIKHPFSFRSSYETVGELPFTNYVSNFKGVVDYIWFARNSLSVRGVLGEVDPDYMARCPGFPSMYFPADHLAIMAEFGVKTNRSSGGKSKENEKDNS